MTQRRASKHYRKLRREHARRDYAKALMNYVEAAADWLTAFASASNSRDRQTANLYLEMFREEERQARRRFERADRAYRKAM